MTWLDRGSRLLHNADDRTADRLAKARTPEARQRIRRWPQLETLGVVASLVGIALLVLAPVATLALAIWFGVAGIDRTDVYWWLCGIAVGVPLVGGGLMAVSGRAHLAACFVDGYVPTGRVGRVIECPGGGDDPASYELRVSVELPSPADRSTDIRPLGRARRGFRRMAR
ncbi:hypothetical protein DY218_20375 [Streptomyces triticagri]|uniref:Uncharacterized protein n=1 Tax=Streptomyces triticagri TaxID=2293568 RepID=A0A372M1P0_9ACTN|nr:hypothetical protein [Streptomyces triticagri]RFU84842.1 hypothetical protein DY218_20375 [Streptomyces triticagri]